MINTNFIKNLEYGELINFSGKIIQGNIDSRKVVKNSAFFALIGENTNGHNYIDAAKKNGASLFVVSKDWHQKTTRGKLPFWIVDSPETALQKLATAWRMEFSIPVLGLTGTNGKTTTRSMIQKILESKYKLHSTIGNFNNHLGLPLTLLKLTPEHDFCLLEMGTNHFGEIKFLCNIAKPTSGLITNIGYGHTEFLKNLAGVSKAKQELFESLSSEGLVFVNIDDPYIKKMKKNGPQISYSFNDKNADFFGKIISYNSSGCPLLEINNSARIQFSLSGNIAAKNGLAAYAVGSSYGIDSDIIINCLENFQPVSMRSVILQEPCKIIDDTYNANPNSTAEAIQTLSLIKTKGQKYFVMGDMLELGEESKALHEDIGRKTTLNNIDIFFGCGDKTRFAIQAAKKAGAKRAQFFDTQVELIRTLKNMLTPEDTILVKGSRGSQMEKIIEGITT